MSRFRLLLAAVIVLGVAAGAGAVAFYLSFVRDLPSFETLADYRPSLTSTVVDRHGRPIGEFYAYRRQLTPLEEVPEVVIQAFLAAEDDTFYEHGGIDYKSILRAAWANLRAGGETVQGASTITQQMVKQLLLSPEQTYRRKVRELILARRIESRFSKDEILYLYLNQIYFGAGAYGIGEASRTYFDKPIQEVDAGEAALLAGLPKAPGRNSPYLNPERAEERRRYVLHRMLEEGFLDEASHAHFVAHPPALRPELPREDFLTASYFTEEIRRLLVVALGNDRLLHEGLRIETTLDLDVQRAAVAAVRRGLEALDRRRGYRGPLRHVAADRLSEELVRIAEQNHIAVATENATGQGRQVLRPEPARETPAPANPARQLALVLEVARERARVALAPGHQAELLLTDHGWARDPEGPRSPLRDLRARLSVGDVVPVTLAPDENEAAQQTLPRALLAQRPEVQGALLSFESGTGDVLALVGGYDFEASEFDRATQAERQPGSAFKPIVYGAAIHHGYTPASIVVDRPVVIESEGFVWRPENYGRRFLGPLILSEALARSVNNAAIHLLQEVGIDEVLAFARRLGIGSPMERNLGLALGSNPLTLLELTRAYGAFASGGKVVGPRILLRVLDRDGRVVLGDARLGEPPRPPDEGGHPPGAGLGAGAVAEEPVRSATLEKGEAVRSSGEEEDALAQGYALTPQEAYLTTSLLRQVIEHPKGTGRRARVLGRPLAGKTGTTNDQGDAWFVGYSPEVVTGVWVGFDEKRVLGRGETGGRAALPIWIDAMRAALADRPVRDFPVPEGIVFARIDARTGLLASPQSKRTLFQPFLAGTEPQEEAGLDLNGSRDEQRLRLGF